MKKTDVFFISVVILTILFILSIPIWMLYDLNRTIKISEKEEWKPTFTAKITKIEFVASGGWGSPNAVRIWRLDNGMAISMPDWKNNSFKEGDTVIQETKSKAYFQVRYKEAK
jgi:hypothetical protein